eukprot:8622640-Alexandrium_andersonii.AAC.1
MDSGVRDLNCDCTARVLCHRWALSSRARGLRPRLRSTWAATRGWSRLPTRPADRGGSTPVRHMGAPSHPPPSARRAVGESPTGLEAQSIK